MSSTCADDGTDWSYTETITGAGNTIRNIVSSGCPKYNIASKCGSQPYSTNTRTDQAKNIDIPSYPVLCDTTATASAQKFGDGIMFDGVSIYRGGNCAVTMAAEDYDPDVCFDPFYEELFDCCNGHPDAKRQYHYHAAPLCTLKDYDAEDDRRRNGHSAQVGWAFDGFPIYGPYGLNNRFILPCTHAEADTRTNDCLDECNGHMHYMDGFKYHYHFGGVEDGNIPDVSQRPYSIGCYVGLPIWDSIRLDHVGSYEDTRTCTTSGVTNDYIPTVASSSSSPILTDPFLIGNIMVFAVIALFIINLCLTLYYFMTKRSSSKRIVIWVDQDEDDITVSQ